MAPKIIFTECKFEMDIKKGWRVVVLCVRWLNYMVLMPYDNHLYNFNKKIRKRETCKNRCGYYNAGGRPKCDKFIIRMGTTKTGFNFNQAGMWFNLVIPLDSFAFHNVFLSSNCVKKILVHMYVLWLKPWNGIGGIYLNDAWSVGFGYRIYPISLPFTVY